LSVGGHYVKQHRQTDSPAALLKEPALHLHQEHKTLQ